MTEEFFSRTEILLGEEALARLTNHHVLIAGMGGVGSFVAEALGRIGIKHLTLLDHDVVVPSNLNRQLVALHSTLTHYKTEVMAARLRDINPQITLTVLTQFLYQEQAEKLISENQFDIVADCIDSVACKAALIAACLRQDVPIVSSLGAGNRLDVTQVRAAYLDQTQRCGLARKLRACLRQLNVPLHYPVIYSEELPRSPPLHQSVSGIPGHRKAVNGTISYMPALFGMMLAGVIVQRLLTSSFSFLPKLKDKTSKRA